MQRFNKIPNKGNIVKIQKQNPDVLRKTLLSLKDSFL